MILSLRSINLSFDYGFFWPLIVFLLSIFISYLCYPMIIRVSKLKKLMSKPNHRSVHKIKTPNLGGIGIFIAINLIITFLGNYFEDSNLTSLLGGVTLLFFTGLIDDLIDLKALHKLSIQTVAAFAVILLTNLRVNDLHGLFGIYELSTFTSTLLTAGIYIFIINAYNLIDGVDGLAGSYAITVTAFFGLFYFFNYNDSMFFLSICIVGSLISFLVFNFSKKEKVFMGDTGSMVIGFLLAYQAIGFLNVDFNPSFLIQNTKAPIYALAIFSFPIIDTFRVFMLRAFKKKNPFTADKSHIHHVFLDFGFNPWKISLLGSFFSIAMVYSVFVFNELPINKQFLFLLSLTTVTVLIIHNLKLLNRFKKRKKKLQEEINKENEIKVKPLFKDLA